MKVQVRCWASPPSSGVGLLDTKLRPGSSSVAELPQLRVPLATMLLGALVLLRKSLRDLDAIVPKLRELGARHVAYGAQAEHYPVVGMALIGSMAVIAGDAWKPVYETAWTEAFELVAAAMLEGAEAAGLEAAA